MMMPSIYELQGDDTYSAIIEDDDKYGQCLAAPKTSLQDLVDLTALRDDHDKVEVHRGFVKTMDLYTQRAERDEDEEYQADCTIPKSISFPADVSVSTAASLSSSSSSDDSTIAPSSAPDSANNATLVLEYLLEKQRQEKAKKRSSGQSRQESSPLAFLLNKQHQDRSKKRSLEKSQQEISSPLAFLLNKKRQESARNQMQERPENQAEKHSLLSPINIASAMKFLAEDRCFSDQEEEKEPVSYPEETYYEQPLAKRNRVSFTNSEYAAEDDSDGLYGFMASSHKQQQNDDSADSDTESSYPEKDSLLDAFDESFERLRRENAKLREALGITSAKEAMARVSQEFAAMENSEDTLPLDETFFTEAAKGEGWDVADPLCGDLLQKDW